MTHREIAAKFASFADEERLAAALRLPVELCPEEVAQALASVELQSDGRVLTSVFLLTENFLCEVDLSSAENEWDYTPLDSVKDYRVKVWEEVIESAGADSEEQTQEQTEVTYKLAKVTLLHDFEDGFSSELTYVGDEPEPWLREVTAAIPIARMAP